MIWYSLGETTKVLRDPKVTANLPLLASVLALHMLVQRLGSRAL